MVLSVIVRVNASAAVANIEKLITGIPNAAKRGTRRAAEDGLNDARRLVHVRTGMLKNSLGIIQETENRTSYGSLLHYAAIEEYGSSRRPAHPYITPRFNVLRDGLAANYINLEIRSIL